jgi:hypothetical protein
MMSTTSDAASVRTPPWASRSTETISAARPATMGDANDVPPAASPIGSPAFSVVSEAASAALATLAAKTVPGATTPTALAPYCE